MNLICFDLDNTLIRSDPAHARGFNEAFVLNGLKRLDLKFLIKNLNGEMGVAIIKRLFPELSKNEVMKIEKQHNDLVSKKYYCLARLIRKDTINVLRELKKYYSLAILSNSTTDEAKALMRGAGIPLSLFDAVVGHDLVKRGKPFPDGILKAQKLAHNKAVLMIGDSIYDIRAGKRAKVKTIAFLTGKFSRNRLKKENPDYIVKNIDFLLAILKNEKLFK